MMLLKSTRVFLFLIFTGIAGFAQNKNAYGLNVVDSYAEYAASLATDRNARLVDIQKAIPNIKLDIKYATSDNFTSQVVYSEASAFARLPVVEALKRVQEELNKQGLGLKIYDAYRPYAVTVKFFEIASDKNFVAHPKTGSRHNRGCAVDLTLIKLKNGKELKMPTPYDSFAPEASPGYGDLPKKVKANREILITVMEKHGFHVLHNEWWHFDFKDWKQFDIMDIPFKEL